MDRLQHCPGCKGCKAAPEPGLDVALLPERGLAAGVGGPLLHLPPRPAPRPLLAVRGGPGLEQYLQYLNIYSIYRCEGILGNYAVSRYWW